MTIRIEETIDAPLEQVFEVFADIERAEERIAGITRVEILSPIRSGLGLRWRETRTMMGQEATEEMEITGFDAPHSYRVEAESHGTHYLTDMRFSDDGGRTRVRWDFTGQPLTFASKAFSLLGFLFAGMTRKMMHGDILALKRHIEARAA